MFLICFVYIDEWYDIGLYVVVDYCYIFVCWFVDKVNVFEGSWFVIVVFVNNIGEVRVECDCFVI